MRTTKKHKISKGATSRAYVGTGTERLLWEDEATYDLYIRYAKLRQTFGLTDRDIKSLVTQQLSLSDLTALSEANDWVARAGAYDKFWGLDRKGSRGAGCDVEGAIGATEVQYSDAGQLAMRVLVHRLQHSAASFRNADLVAIARLAPMITRSKTEAIRTE
jgi:hypothetical protein